MLGETSGLVVLQEQNIIIQHTKTENDDAALAPKALTYKPRPSTKMFQVVPSGDALLSPASFLRPSELLPTRAEQSSVWS